MAKINVLINNEKYDFDKGITLFEISKKVYKGKFPVLACYMDNEIHSLDVKVMKNCSIKFINVMDSEGNRIYQKALLFILVYSFKELFGYGYNVKACHSIDKAIKMRTNLKLNSIRINELKKKMHEVIKADMPIKKCLVSRKEARKYFLDIGDTAKADTFIYNTNHYVNLYKLGDMYDYYFSDMPISTSVIKDFDLFMLDSGSFLLQFPYLNFDGKIPEYVDREKIINAFDENYSLAKKLGIFNSADLNMACADGKISDIIKLTETISSNKLLELAKEIYSKRSTLKIVLIAGPSSSGKTTTAKKLAMFLKSFGMNPKSLSIDDYFLNREDTPKLENGEYDYESISAVNIELFNDHLTRLINGEEVSIPTYNFIKGKGEYLGNRIMLNNDDILIIEGLHAVNEDLTKAVAKDRKYKVYISPLSDLNIDNHNMISNSDVRLLRRIVRDNRTRGYSAEDTIKTWDFVRDGEEKYIFPYQGDVNYVYNSSLIYEIGVLKLYAEPLLYGIDNTSVYYEEVIRLLNFLNMFVGIPTDEIPNDSILREFIGGSYFE